MIGLPGPTVRDEDVRLFRDTRAGGLILYRRNFESPPQLVTHLRLPTIESTWAEMHATHLPPFLAAIGAGVDCVMTSHPRYPALDPSGVPATFSRRIVEEYLRGEVGFRGVIVSDDLEMGAIAETSGIGEATVRAGAAGHDLLLVCHTEAAQRAAHRALLDAYGGG